MIEDQLAKKILMQVQIVNIENRLEELRKPININDNSDEDMGTSGGSEGEAEAMMALLLDRLVEMNLTN